MIKAYFEYYAYGVCYGSTENHDFPSEFNCMSDLIKFIEAMRKRFKVTKVEIEFEEQA